MGKVTVNLQKIKVRPYSSNDQYYYLAGINGLPYRIADECAEEISEGNTCWYEVQDDVEDMLYKELCDINSLDFIEIIKERFEIKKKFNDTGNGREVYGIFQWDNATKTEISHNYIGMIQESEYIIVDKKNNFRIGLLSGNPSFYKEVEVYIPLFIRGVDGDETIDVIREIESKFDAFIESFSALYKIVKDYKAQRSNLLSRSYDF